MNRSNLGFLPVLTTASAALLGRSAAVNTNFNYDDAGLLHAHDGTDTTNTGGTNDNQSNQAGTGEQESRDQQQDQANQTGNAQQGNPDDDGDGTLQQDQSTLDGNAQQGNIGATTDTAAGTVDTDESVDGRQPE